MSYLIVRNNKAPLKNIFEYLREAELRNPNPEQAELLKTICDGIEFTEEKTQVKPPDQIFEINYKGEISLQVY